MANQGEKTSANQPSQGWAALWENIRVLLIALAIAIVVRWLIAEPRYIPSGSMLPTLDLGDRIVVEKLSYHFQPVHQGDVVVFRTPPQLELLGYNPQQAFIKRVIATAGQTVSVHNGSVYVDQEPLTEPFIAAKPDYELPELTVPEHTFFVLGDNRNNSNDSHIWGFVPAEHIIGHAIFKFWPFNHFGSII
ncbi:signal peptidase I [[Synechococcus] sp. NIES-970]|uniref:signal peptidase I n=1 Tax=Picosynechococcus sp. NKBG15041c TaxID=1407650 RepID=UPI00042429AF|nr:signal peptidase I [Picosynechococcus sp. NKBG15041c]BAW95844.1 signal peptidase I [[Synechococcus] sp. NIES-970]